jgi:hypothetical protein
VKFRGDWQDSIVPGIKQYEGKEMNLVLVRHEEDILEVMLRFRVKFDAA